MHLMLSFWVMPGRFWSIHCPKAETNALLQGFDALAEVEEKTENMCGSSPVL